MDEMNQRFDETLVGAQDQRSRFRIVDEHAGMDGLQMGQAGGPDRQLNLVIDCDHNAVKNIFEAGHRLILSQSEEALTLVGHLA